MHSEQYKDVGESKFLEDDEYDCDVIFRQYELKGQTKASLESLKKWKLEFYDKALQKGGGKENDTINSFAIQRKFGVLHNETMLTFLSSGLGSNNKATVAPESNELQLKMLISKLTQILDDVENAKKKASDEAGKIDYKSSQRLHYSEISLILRYNIALSYLCSGNSFESQRLLMPVYNFMMHQSETEETNEEEETFRNPAEVLSTLYCDIAFLLLECVIHDNSGSCSLASNSASKTLSDSLFKWIADYLKKHEKEIYANEPDALSATALHELKFRNHLYKSKILFIRGNTAETQRLSKKEMKSAMEILQHKLRQPDSATGEEAPVLNDMSAATDKKYHQIALYLKANSEHLKGNTKKALKLCAEATSAGEDQLDTRSSDDLENLLEAAMHHNNLAIIHQSAGKVHIALHYYVRALSLIERLESFHSRLPTVNINGFASPIPLAEILYNASLCAAQAEKWENSYECMVKCINASPQVFASRSRCWLRVAEACIGIYTSIRNKEASDFSYWIDDSRSLSMCRSKNQSSPFFDSVRLNESMPLLEQSNLGSPEDLKLCRNRPLERALQCLHKALQTSRAVMPSSPEKTKTQQSEDEIDCMESILACLSYVHLGLRDPCAALQAALDLLQRPIPPAMMISEDIVAHNQVKSGDGNSDEAAENLAARSRFKKAAFFHRREKVRLYACECLCTLGRPEEALRLLSELFSDELGDKANGGYWSLALESMSGRLSLSSSLPSGTSEISVSSPSVSAKVREIDNNSLICASVSLGGINASSGNLSAAHALSSAAMQRVVQHSVDDVGGSLQQSQDSATNMPIESTLCSSYSAAAKRSLLYCLLKKGEIGNALELLQYAR